MNNNINSVFSMLNIPLINKSGEADSAQIKGLHITDSAIADHITQQLASNATGNNGNVDMHAGVRSPQFMQLLNNSQQILQTALAKPGDAETVKLVLPKSSQQSGLICMLIELANQASIADIDLSSTFGIMSENSSMSAANAQKAQGLAIFSKNIISSSINMAGTGVATRKSVNNYSSTKVNINQNLKGMHESDLAVRQMQNSLGASKNDRLDLSDIATSSSSVKKSNGGLAELSQQERTLRTEHQAVAARNLDETISNRDAFNTAFLQGEARTRLTSTQIEAQRAIGMAGASVADGSGSLAHSTEQKEETEERSEAKVMDGAVEMSRQQAQKSQQLLANMMNLLNDVRRTEADLVGAFANNMKA